MSDLSRIFWLITKARDLFSKIDSDKKSVEATILEMLKELLDKAIIKEKFEVACALRDAIKQLQYESGTPG